MSRYNRAMSPLIAAVLLMVVVVGIGGVVMGIVRGFVTENKDMIDSKSDAMSCSRDVGLSVVDIDGTPQVCIGADYGYVIIENTGAIDIDDFQMVVMGTAGFYRNGSLNATMSFSPGETSEFNGSFNAASVGTVQQIKFIPKLKKSGSADYHYCTDVAYKYEGLIDCADL